MRTYDKLATMIYKLRDMGEFPELECKETGEKWKDLQTPFVYELLTLRRLAKKHHRLAEMACNGEGVIRGQFYSMAVGGGIPIPCTKTAYVSDDMTVFDVESDKVEAKIKAICDRLGLRVEFQGDPRGYTVKFYKGDRFLDIQG